MMYEYRCEYCEGMVKYMLDTNNENEFQRVPGLMRENWL